MSAGATGPDQALVDDCVNNAHGNFPRVKEIIDAHPELVESAAQWGETPLQAGSQMGQKEIVEYLLAKGARLDFFAACMLGRFDDVVRFLEADPGLATGSGVHGLPSLYFAAVGGQTRIAELLLGGGADLNAGQGGDRPLHGAAAKGHQEMVEWLLDNRADINAPGYEGRTPLALAMLARQEGTAAVLRVRGAHE
jgi:ankyrin repeat protein